MEQCTTRHLTPTQLADRWGMQTGSLANQRSNGRGCTYLRLGGRVAYREVDVLAYELASVVPTSAA